jgi:hypothetical protein
MGYGADRMIAGECPGTSEADLLMPFLEIDRITAGKLSV